MYDERIWHGARPACAPAGTLVGPTGRTVTHDVYVLAPENFERAEQAIALCLAHGLLEPARRPGWARGLKWPNLSGQG